MMLVLAAVACGLPAQTGGPAATGADLPATLAVEPTPTAEPEPPPPPSDFAAVLDAEVAAGEITYEEGLIRLLRSFLGDPEVTLPAAYAEVVTTEGNSIVERAADYIADGTDEAAKAEMARLLDILVPTTEQLQAYSQPAGANIGGPGLARPPAQIDCAGLYRAGFPLEGVTTYPCFEYVTGSVGGVGSYTIYYPASWAAGDPRRSWLAQADEASQASMVAFGPYGPIGPVNIIFSLVPGGSASYLAQVSAYHPGATDVCPLLIFPSALGRTEGEFKQVVAHELFHCFQLHNLTGQLLGVHQDIKKWWSEGSAEYFSNIVYPDVDYEHRWIRTFDGNAKHTPLYLMGYENFGFFQFMGNRVGDAGVLAFLGSLPTSGGSDSQRDRLAAATGIAEAFHQFGEAYLDSRIIDSAGAEIFFGPDRGVAFEIPRDFFYEAVEPQPFVLDRRLLRFADDTRFTIDAGMGDGEGRYTVEVNGQPGIWGPLPTSLNTACSGGEFQLLVTSAVPSGATPATLFLETTGEEVEDETECETCLIGTWTLDNSTYLAHMGGLWPILVSGMSSFGLDTGGAESHPTDVFGLMQITFRDDMRATGIQEGWGIAGEATGEDGTVHSKMVYNGTGEALWRVETDEAADQRYVFFDGGSFSLSGQMTFEVFPLRPISFGESNDSVFLSSPQPFLCDATTLTYYAQDPLGPVVFIRGVEEEPAP